ncbi:porin [Massilia endophytica]|uniref:porin n=1 Tax=Massilia endophytica TaxID=2899220 RepID=UPI001E29EC82|nr:porin [Massilia endophytica]UGQ47453.1 porin [Massilia endophytica]
MKKSNAAALAAVMAAACGAATAQTSVVINGVVDMYAGSLKYSGDAARRTVVNNGGLTTSQWGFMGVEDLGGGLKADFSLSGFFQGDTGAAGRFGTDTLFSRHAYIGLSGSFGKVMVGRFGAPSFLPALQFNPFGDSFQFSPLILHTYVPSGPVGARTWAATTAGDSGWSNQVSYATPVYKGLQANFFFQPGETGKPDGPKNYGANAFYNNGPLGLTMVYTHVGVSNPLSGAAILDATAAPVNYGSITSQNGYFVGARYDFKVVKAYATYRHNSNDAAGGKSMDDHTYTLSVSVPTSAAGAVLASYADTERSGSLLGADRSRDTLTLGYNHRMSARTDLYAIYMSDRLSTASRERSAALGIRHRF